MVLSLAPVHPLKAKRRFEAAARLDTGATEQLRMSSLNLSVSLDAFTRCGRWHVFRHVRKQCGIFSACWACFFDMFRKQCGCGMLAACSSAKWQSRTSNGERASMAVVDPFPRHQFKSLPTPFRPCPGRRKHLRNEPHRRSTTSVTNRPTRGVEKIGRPIILLDDTKS